MNIDRLIPDYMAFTDANCNRCAMNEAVDDGNGCEAPGCDVARAIHDCLCGFIEHVPPAVLRAVEGGFPGKCKSLVPCWTQRPRNWTE